ncbi:unnamed protein product [Caenorhabditis bovis]|uniref:Uncharacterized protein n=1 Tax=Caenorhabditis bovis TaxID=2654633 RepID=A0A8S1E4S8_9PELO|nr:unnamed protein product [Caenorhabditis bovis]
MVVIDNGDELGRKNGASKKATRTTTTTTPSPILCLMNWHDENCRKFKSFNVPRFASNYEMQKSRKSRVDDGSNENPTSGFISPIIPTLETTTLISTAAVRRFTTSMPKTTTTLPVFFLSQIETDEGSGDDLFVDDALGITPATKPTTIASTTKIAKLTRTTMTTTTTTNKPLATTRVSTVLPRPYESVLEAAEQNPDYLGASIWNQIDALPEPMVTGPAWRTNKSTTRSSLSSSSSATTTTKSKTSASSARRQFYDSTPASRELNALIASSIATPVNVRPKATNSYSVYPVRPTTPMGETITTTMQTAAVSDFPRTPLIMCSSLAVIVAIAAVVFFVFKCRQNPPSGDHYTIAMKTQSGYTAIAPELSPPMNHDRNNESCTQPLLQKPQINGNGYEPLKGSVIPNGGASATLPRNGNGVAKKKDFKEWYV